MKIRFSFYPKESINLNNMQKLHITSAQYYYL